MTAPTDGTDPQVDHAADPLTRLRARIAAIHAANPLPPDDGKGLRALLSQTDLRRTSAEFQSLSAAFLAGRATPADVRRHPDYAQILGQRVAEKREG